ncbi:MAG: hypothetical protein AB7G93_14815 [Bdellovibrionales bacterium]
MREILPFLIQGTLMGVDEFYCHRHRQLGRWERIGHPLDTAVFLACLAWLLGIPPGEGTLSVYMGLSVSSCLMVSKDEWEHRTRCTGFENWLHALLFMIHPVVLIWAGYLWWTGAERFLAVVGTAAVATGLFFVYQVLYWNLWRYDQQRVL